MLVFFFSCRKYLGGTWGLSRESSVIVNLMRIVGTTPGSQGEGTGMCMREKWWLHVIVSGGSRGHWIWVSMGMYYLAITLKMTE